MTDTDRDDLLFAADFISWKRGDHTEMGEDEANRIEALLRRLARIPAPAPDVVERVAQAILREDHYAHEKPILGPLNEQTPDDIEQAMRQARAALSAIPIPATGEVERARIDVELALANWQKYNGEPQDEIVYQAEKVASAAKDLSAALTDHTTKGAE